MRPANWYQKMTFEKIEAWRKASGACRSKHLQSMVCCNVPSANLLASRMWSRFRMGSGDGLGLSSARFLLQSYRVSNRSDSRADEARL